MKILGVSLGTKNGNNDTMCRVALEAAKEKGAEIEFIHLLDWDIQYCSGCGFQFRSGFCITYPLRNAFMSYRYESFIITR